MVASAGQLIDLKRYPIDDPARAVVVLDQVRKSLRLDGCAAF
ncbi:hypothetical protein N4R57_12930 [Rhodobacteraceae bacterium D3-12]|nr:hypothetical protein N4R57_12930 [Rhodobacteraceae bacterium D3-12]